MLSRSRDHLSKSCVTGSTSHKQAILTGFTEREKAQSATSSSASRPTALGSYNLTEHWIIELPFVPTLSKGQLAAEIAAS